MKTFLRFILFALISIIGFILLYLIAAFGLSKVTVNEDWKQGDDVTIYLLSNGVHADIVLPVKSSIIDWSHFTRYENTTGNDTTQEWIGFGWGDKGFFLQTPTWGDLTFDVAFRAIAGLSTSAMHTTFHNRLVEKDRCVRFKIRADEYQKLCDFILASFKRNSSGDLIQIKTNANYGTNDVFYEANGKYHLFHTCNTWTNDALKSAGLKASWWTPFESGVLYHYKVE